eukprot:8201386-Lingulodinium_polyedra.AAC.1
MFQPAGRPRGSVFLTAIVPAVSKLVGRQHGSVFAYDYCICHAQTGRSVARFSLSYDHCVRNA